MDELSCNKNPYAPAQEKLERTFIELLIQYKATVLSAEILSTIDFENLITPFDVDQIKFNNSLIDEVILNVNRKERTIKEVLI